MNEDKLCEVTDTFIIPAWLSGMDGDEILGNVMSLLMDTMNYDKIAKAQRDYSCDEDFSNTKRTNYAKEDHNKRFNHSEVEKLKKVSLPMSKLLFGQLYHIYLLYYRTKGGKTLAFPKITVKYW